MPQPSPSWDTRRVHITYRSRLTGALESGTWMAQATGRITNRLPDGKTAVFRAGKIGEGDLNVTEGLPSFTADLPIVDDPDNTPNGGYITLVFSFGNQTETHQISPLLSWPTGSGPYDGTDLALLLDPANIPIAPPLAMLGVPGGVARLDSDGDVVNAAGQKVTGAALFDPLALPILTRA